MSKPIVRPSQQRPCAGVLGPPCPAEPACSLSDNLSYPDVNPRFLKGQVERDSPGGPVIKTACFPMHGAQVWCLVKELRSSMVHSLVKKLFLIKKTKRVAPFSSTRGFCLISATGDRSLSPQTHTTQNFLWESSVLLKNYYFVHHTKSVLNRTRVSNRDFPPMVRQAELHWMILARWLVKRIVRERKKTI